MPVVLVIEPSPTDPVARLGDWLTEAGMTLDVRRVGDQIPADLTGHDAVVVLGGPQSSLDPPEALPWMSEVRRAIRAAIDEQVPLLAICLGAQLLAQEAGGVVQVADDGPELGARVVGKRDAAFEDPIFAELPITPIVLQWHHDAIESLPEKAVLLANSPMYPHQAYRVGPCGWGIQFHIEPTAEMIGDWAANDADGLAAAGLDGPGVVTEAEQVLAEVAEVWGRFAARFAGQVAAGARGER